MKLFSWQNSGQRPFAVLLLVLFVASFPALAQAPVTKSTTIEQYSGKSYYLHTVLPKQTLYGIAKAYNVDQQTIINANPDAKNGLRISQVLRIPTGTNLQPTTTYTENRPAKTASTPLPTGEIDYVNDYEIIYHVAKKDDSFRHIADIYLVLESNIRLANPSLKEPLKEGEYVVVPIAPKDNRPPVTTQESFQRTNFDPFTNPSSKEKSRPANTETTDNTAPVMISHNDNSSSQQKAPVMVEPFSIPKDAQPKTAEIGSSTPEKTALIGEQHIVKPGETLYSISKQYGLSTEVLIGLNPGIASGVRAGQVLLLPEKATYKQTAAPQNENQTDSLLIHIVQKGETLYRISRNYAVSIVKLKQLNPGLTTDLRPGQQIAVPKKKITRPYLIHDVEDGTRTKRLARDFDIEADELYQLNPNIGRRLYPGQLIKVPLLPGVEVTPIEPKAIETPLELEEEIISDTTEENVFEIGDCISGFYHSNKTFKVALMIPLYLEGYENLRWSSQSSESQMLTNKSFSFLSFYEGFLIAADSLAKTQGLKLDLKIYDVDMEMGKAYDAIADSDLQETDLIIGPFFNKAFEVVAPFALRYQIPIVNPFTQREETTLNNPAIIKIKPSLVAQYDQLADLIAVRYPHANVFIYRAHSYKHVGEAEMLRTKLQDRLAPMVPVSAAAISRVAKERSKRKNLQNDLVPVIRIEKREFYPSELANRPFDSIYFDNPIRSFVYANDSVREFRRSASTVRENLVIVLSDDNVFSTEFVNKMSQVADTFSITLVGLPEWEQFDQLFVESLMKMKAIYFSPSLVNYEDYFTQLFIKQFRDRFSSEPDRYAFEGFDIGWYFMQAFLNLGKNPLPCLPTFQVPLLQSQYFFERSNYKNGLENKYWNMYQFDHYKKMPILNSHFIKGANQP
ncbi:MAG: LysM peptidoglycan-binding domain-containing protein [Bacteroidales bacterium]|nr:LysM peptidoglycan-binding domain-containing protein [Bacteroidales bacterium]